MQWRKIRDHEWFSLFLLDFFNSVPGPSSCEEMGSTGRRRKRRREGFILGRGSELQLRRLRHQHFIQRFCPWFFLPKREDELGQGQGRDWHPAAVRQLGDTSKKRVSQKPQIVLDFPQKVGLRTLKELSCEANTAILILIMFRHCLNLG